MNSWDALENILQQCLDNPNGGGFKNNMPNGNWRFGDEWYWIHINNNVTPGAPTGSDGKQ